jgi:hypothetical protein
VTAPHPPGWYPDPSGPPLWRWWDGTSWTEHTSPGGGAATAQPQPQPQYDQAPQGGYQPQQGGYQDPGGYQGQQHAPVVDQGPGQIWDQSQLLYEEQRAGGVTGAPFDISIPDGPLLATVRNPQQGGFSVSFTPKDVLTEVRDTSDQLLFTFLDPGGFRDKPNPVLDAHGNEHGDIRDAPGLKAHAYDLVTGGRVFARVQPAGLFDQSKFPVTDPDGTVLAIVHKRTKRGKDDWLLERSTALSRSATAVLLAAPLQLNASIDRARKDR